MDSVIGGGGLLTLPSLFLLGNETLTSVASNKVAGVTAALVAFLVYFRKISFNFKFCLLFTAAVLCGSLLGSLTANYFIRDYFKILILIACPAILYFIWNKEKWIYHLTHDLSVKINQPLIVVCGLLVGFYDGSFGPGGGTAMFLVLVGLMKVPVMQALVISKAVNLISAAAALSGYWYQGLVDFRLVLPLAVGICLGAFCGANLALRNIEKILKPLLTAVVILLMSYLFLGF